MSTDLVRKMKGKSSAKRIVINDKYISTLHKDWAKKLKEDLTDVFGGGEVVLGLSGKPRFDKKGPNYQELRSHIAYWSLVGDYSIFTSDPFDARMIKAAGGRLSSKSAKPYSLNEQGSYS
jgi:hypothetical protein